jgi:hypothetical protein
MMYGLRQDSIIKVLIQREACIVSKLYVVVDSTTLEQQDTLSNNKLILIHPVELLTAFKLLPGISGRKRGPFLRGHISLKNWTYCPLLRESATPFKSTCLLTK